MSDYQKQQKHLTLHQASKYIHCTDDARQRARKRMPKMMFDFVEGAAGREYGKELNSLALQQTRLQPRVLVNVDGRTLNKTFLDKDMGLPFGIAPMGMCNLMWPGADKMLAAEACRRNIPLCLSSAASSSIEDMAKWTDKQAWFQLYVGQSREAAMSLVDRAAQAGYKYLILTVDVPQVSRRIRDLRNGFKMPFSMGPKQFLDFACHPKWSLSTLFHGIPSPKNFSTNNGGKGFVRNESRGNTDWAFLDELRQYWKGKLIVKGVLSPHDAEQIKKTGADAIYVSNHGGRQLDSAPAAIEALPKIRAAVGPNYPLIFDSGLRNGEDIIKALALGADFVMMGRTMAYAMGADGARGLSSIIDILAEEISVTLAQLGHTNVNTIDSRVLTEVNDLSQKPIYKTNGLLKSVTTKERVNYQ